MYKNLFGTDLVTYDILNLVSFFVLVIYNLANVKKKKHLLSHASLWAQNKIENSRLKNKFLSSYIPWAITEIILISLVQFAFTAQINAFFGELVGTDLNYFGLLFITPILLVAFCLLIGVNFLKQIDLITPAFPLALIFTKLACFGSGCCHGVYWKYGLYNETYSRLEFPVQLLEAGIALLLFAFLLYWRKKAKPGTLFPTYLILYSATRFFSEFGVEMLPIRIINLKIYQIICIFGFIVGIIELSFVLRKNNMLIKTFDKNHKEIYQQIVYQLEKKQKQRNKTKQKQKAKQKAKQKSKQKAKQKKL